MAELQLALEDAYGWEETAPTQLWMTQPIGNGGREAYDADVLKAGISTGVPKAD